MLGRASPASRAPCQTCPAADPRSVSIQSGAFAVMKNLQPIRALRLLMFVILAGLAAPCLAEEAGVGAGADDNADVDAIQSFLDRHCLECHESVSKKGGLDLTELPFDLASSQV